MYGSNRQSGFTLVELLIVIIVIAILATISIVAYRGLRERAVTVAYTVAVDQWDKFLIAEAAMTGSLPGTASFVCAGRSASDFPAEDGFAAGECFRMTPTGGSGGLSVNFDSNSSTFFNALQGGGLPTDGKLPTTTFTFTAAGITYRSRAILIGVNSTNRTYTLQWVPQVSGECGRGTTISFTTPGELTGDMCAMLRHY